MNAFEWVGFFVSALSVIFLIGRALYDGIQNEKNPSKYKAHQEEAERRFKAFLRGETPSPTIDRVLREVIEEDDEEDERPQRPLLKKAVLAKQQYQQQPFPPAPVPQEAKPLPFIAKRENSRAKTLLIQESSPKNIVVLYEIFGPPKGLR